MDYISDSLRWHYFGNQEIGANTSRSISRVSYVPWWREDYYPEYFKAVVHHSDEADPNVGEVA